jgi:hypothetical protein
MKWRTALVGCGLLIALAVTGCTGDQGGPVTPPGPRTSPLKQTDGPPGQAKLEHIVIIVDENKPATSIIGNPDAPYLNSLAQTYAWADRYSAVTHPSLPNYLALTSGTTAGISSDCAPGGSCLVTGPNLAQAIDRSGRTWKMYAESMTAPCTATNTNTYAVKHNPFLYFPSVTTDRAYCSSHDVPYDRFAADLTGTKTLPNFAFISPNLCNDMHDCSIQAGDRWLQANVPRILSSPAFTSQRSLLVVTFDEGDAADNTIACVFAGPAARSHTRSSAPFTHYSLLRTIESEWRIEPLTAEDAAATPMTALLN